MPDITMCEGQTELIECSLKENCYRYKAIPNEWRQAYFYGIPVYTVEGKQFCDSYSPLRKGD